MQKRQAPSSRPEHSWFPKANYEGDTETAVVGCFSICYKTFPFS